MPKRRTREQKEKALHNFTVSWNSDNLKASSGDSKLSVKNQNVKPVFANQPTVANELNTRYSDKYFDLASMKRDLIKSLTFASLILASELVLYFIWH